MFVDDIRRTHIPRYDLQVPIIGLNSPSIKTILLTVIRRPPVLSFFFQSPTFPISLRKLKSRGYVFCRWDQLRLLRITGYVRLRERNDTPRGLRGGPLGSVSVLTGIKQPSISIPLTLLIDCLCREKKVRRV